MPEWLHNASHCDMLIVTFKSRRKPSPNKRPVVKQIDWPMFKVLFITIFLIMFFLRVQLGENYNI